MKLRNWHMVVVAIIVIITVAKVGLTNVNTCEKNVERITTHQSN